MSKTQEKLIKSIIKSRVPKEKRKEVLGAFDKLDLGLLIENMKTDPNALSEMLRNPSKLSEYVVEDGEGDASVDEIDTSIAEENVLEDNSEETAATPNET